MSNPDIGSVVVKTGVKTLAIRLEPDLHTQLSLIAQLRASTITDEIRTAIEAHIALAKTAPELAARAGSVLEDIEREAFARRTAIATLFGNDQTDEATAETGPAPTARNRGRKAAGETEVICSLPEGRQATSIDLGAQPGRGRTVSRTSSRSVLTVRPCQ